MSLKTRIAPTPSGYLHEGNLINFCITHVLAQAHGATIRLRIDDADSQRMRPEYVADIFDALDWLQINWHEGPRSVDDFMQNHRQLFRAARYNELIQYLTDTKRVFACPCSRSQLFSGRHADHCCSTPANRADVALRLVYDNTKAVELLNFEGEKIKTNLPSFPEPVIRKKDGFAAYTICSLADDIDYGINMIVRGNDLLEQSALQVYVASLIEPNQFAQSRFFHHPLITDKSGNKLSKSAGVQAKSVIGNTEVMKNVLAASAQILGIRAKINRLVDLTDCYVVSHK